MYHAHIFERDGELQTHVCAGDKCPEQAELKNDQRSEGFDTQEEAFIEMERMQADASHDPAECEYCA